jgi:hypothetical protein
MSKIKKFFEFFDDEDLKARHEIEYLTGEIKNFAKTVDVNFKDETIENFLSKIIYSFPFMSAFMQASQSKGGEYKFRTFRVLIKYTEEDKFYNFIATDDTIMVALGIKILGNNKYDTFVMIDDINEEDVRVFEEDNVSYQELCEIIAHVYIQEITNVDFYDLIKYNFEEIIVRSN